MTIEQQGAIEVTLFLLKFFGVAGSIIGVVTLCAYLCSYKPKIGIPFVIVVMVAIIWLICYATYLQMAYAKMPR